MKSCSDCFLDKKAPDLSAATKAALLQSRTIKQVSPGSCILSQGSIPASLYCVCQGHINGMENDVHGRNFLVFSLKRSGLFPLSSLFSKTPTKFEFISPGPATLCQFPMSTVENLLDSDGGLCKTFLQRACSQGLDAFRRMTTLQLKGTSEKVLQTLHQFKDEENICSLTRQEIATWTNLSIETVIRTLTTLEKKKKIKKLDRKIEIF